MIHQRTKDLCFFLTRFPLRIVGSVYRCTWGLRNRKRGLRLHLGCGTKYLPSFINIDANPFRKIDLWLDVRNPLPFPDGTMEGIYLQETAEHLYPDELEGLLRQCLRVLMPGGYIRIGVPHLRHAVEAYLEGRASWFSDWPHPYRSPGGRLASFLLCDGQHRNIFDFPMLQELLMSAGFSSVTECAPGISSWIDPRLLSGVEPQPADGPPSRSLYVEARKP